MDDHYTCLACVERPVFQGKILAYGHAREAHAGVLEDHHVEELFEVRSAVREFEFGEETAGPYFCDVSDECEQKFVQRDGIVFHIKNAHSIYSAELGVHYITEADKIRRAAEAEREVDRQARAFGLRVGTLCGVTDFLTECRA